MTFHYHLTDSYVIHRRRLLQITVGARFPPFPFPLLTHPPVPPLLSPFVFSHIPFNCPVVHTLRLKCSYRVWESAVSSPSGFGRSQLPNACGAFSG